MKRSASTKKAALVACAVILLTGCLPAALDKYRRKSGTAASDSSLLHPGADVAAPAPASSLGEKTTAAASTSTDPGRQQATIYAIDKRTFRFLVKDDLVWNAMLDVLLRNYNLTIVDQQTGIVTTEWDSYYLNNAVFRNKISMRFNRVSRNVVDVTIHNNVERLRDASQAAGTVGAVWLPAEDEDGETARIIQNMALLLNQPPPLLPPGMELAKDLRRGDEAR